MDICGCLVSLYSHLSLVPKASNCLLEISVVLGSTLRGQYVTGLIQGCLLSSGQFWFRAGPWDLHGSKVTFSWIFVGNAGTLKKNI